MKKTPLYKRITQTRIKDKTPKKIYFYEKKVIWGKRPLEQSWGIDEDGYLKGFKTAKKDAKLITFNLYLTDDELKFLSCFKS